MKKKHDKKKYLRIILISSLLCLVGISIVFVRYRLLTMNNYFINFEKSEQVHAVIASKFIIGETTRTEVENAIDDGIFGDLDCYYNNFAANTYTINSRMTCKALGSYAFFIPKYYRILLGFRGNVLTEIQVNFFHPDAL